ncbi:MAG: FAD-dependent oxidoreductase, partial [Gaiellales bacterium]
MTIGDADVLVVGSGNAGLCAAIAALRAGADVLILEKAEETLAGGNSRYTAGAMRFAYDDASDLLPLLADPDDPRLEATDFGSYPEDRFAGDLLGFNDGRPLSPEQRILVDESLDVVRWLADNGVLFEPIYQRQSYEQDGRRVFWGGLTLAAADEGVGLIEAELSAVRDLGGRIRYASDVVGLVSRGERIAGVVIETADGDRSEVLADAVVLGCGGFEADPDRRVEHLGPEWAVAKVRGTPHNTGVGLELALAAGAEPYGLYGGCHATPVDRHMA